MKVAIITYSTYGHIDALAQDVKKGVEKAGGKATVYRVSETLPEEVLQQMNAPEKPEDIPVATPETLSKYDAFLFGVPTRFGTVPAQWTAFWDATGSLWANGELNGKVAGFFVSTSTYGGGQESTVKNCMSYLVHHGIIYIPLGYKTAFSDIANIEEIHGGSPWGAGTLAGADGSRQVSSLESRIAFVQGESFYEVASKIVGGKSSKTAAAGSAAAAGTGGATKKAAAKQNNGSSNSGSKPAARENRAVSKADNKTENAKSSDSGKCCIIM
ncbi:hypothetical protein TBLA_0C00700 [Henningerozyma blattae CBS 6284]|uniref:Flavodoxin-like domain-containing protein n=1 Tax=Henningerozyma blattae (strain ATCC 34711 / CBS 6284 / DSM 70876 / NBRC 10599 / NRRL Y-10934 / UCD 77-7) TaxID=1071380 RepID=I2H0I4_HENB6|nr:hypothetical protein TBLA_0C00700 [Tetrapisispora blattae CBS 6284]CCH59886.1 hypothetical protein TBLA_0C00700 [Tetrapisispora blattae CBS 6284]